MGPQLEPGRQRCPLPGQGWGLCCPPPPPAWLLLGGQLLLPAPGGLGAIPCSQEQDGCSEVFSP